MRKSVSLFLLFCLCATASVLAQIPSKSAFEPGEDKIRTLEKLHEEAEQQVLANRFEEALKTYEEITLVEPDDETAYTAIGQIHLILGNTQAAQAAFMNALNINPGNETAQFGLRAILDPDGVRGLVMPVEMEKEEKESEAPIPAKLEPVFLKQAESPRIEALMPLQKPVKIENPYEAELDLRPRATFQEEVQRALSKAGFYKGPMDGQMGPKSLEAIRVFQSSRHLKADGKVNPQTWAALREYLEKKNS